MKNTEGNAKRQGAQNQCKLSEKPSLLELFRDAAWFIQNYILMIDTNQLSALISAFRVETEKESISPGIAIVCHTALVTLSL